MRTLASTVTALVLAAPGLLAQEPSSGTVIRWTDLAGVPHLSSEPPKEYEVTREEWQRLKSEYPDRVKDEAPQLVEDLAALPPGLRAEAALRDWWNIAGPRGGYRGSAVVTPEEAAELARLKAIAREALKEARGTDLSPATGRAAADMRRAEEVRVEIRDPDDLSGVPLERAYPLRLGGSLVRTSSATRYDVKGRISNRTAHDAAGLVVSLFLHLDGKLVGSREVVVPRLMARGESPIQTSFSLDPKLGALDQARLSMKYAIEQPPPASGGGS